MIRSLVDFGAPLHDLSEAGLAAPGLVFQIGVPPLRIDVMTSIDGVSFADAWPDRVTVRLGRLQDLAGLERLEGIEGAGRGT